VEDDGIGELRDTRPAWEIGAAFGGGYYARWRRSSPQIRVTAPSVTRLGELIAVAEEAAREVPFSWRAVDAAVKRAQA
jgi:hypothetical protein